MKKKYIIHIGYPKTATTWLQRDIFPNHPGISFNYEKCLPYLMNIINAHPFDFNPKFIRDSIDEILDDNRKIRLLSLERLSGDPFHGGMDSIVIANRLKAIFPEAKIIIVIRNQISMIESLYRQYIHQGGVCSFKKFINLPESAIYYFSSNYLRYNKLIEYYINLFGKQNVYVSTYELLKEDSDKFFLELFKFMEIDDYKLLYKNRIKTYNKGMTKPSLFIKRFFNRFFYSYFNHWSVFPGKFGSASIIRRLLQEFLDPYLFQHIFKNNAIMTESHKEEINKIYKDENIELLTKYSIPVDKYNYPGFVDKIKVPES